ncbi:MAG: glycosyltransferase [Verrucomicrobiota bacterium]
MTRWVVFLLGFFLLVAGCLPFASLARFDEPTVWRSFGFLFQAAGVALCWGFYPLRDRHSRLSVFLVVLVSITLRVILWPTPESDDVYRYRWEGTLVLSGINPFEKTADDPSLAEFQNEDWQRMNHKDRGTVYPPVAQFVFAGTQWLSGVVSQPLDKLVFVLFDLATLFVVFSLLRRRSLPSHFALLYSINPVILLSFAGEAHYDSLFVFLLTSAALALEKGWVRLSWLMLAISAQVKLVSLVLLPVWLLQRAFRGWWILPLLILVTWLPFVGALETWISSLKEFGGTSTFQGLIPLLLREFEISESLASPIGGVLGGCALLFIFWKGGSPSTLIRRVIGALILFSPILHFWYLSWFLPFLCLRPSLSWIWLCLSQSLYFLVWVQFEQTGYWELPDWAEWTIWGPFLVLGVFEGNRLRQQRRVRYSRESNDDERTIGVVIPTLNAGDTLAQCLDSISKGKRAPDGLIISDGGSTDNTLDIASQHGIQVVSSPRGRGSQIFTGIEAMETDWILIVHADCIIQPLVLSEIQSLDTSVVGGACGQRFLHPSSVLTLVEFMNEGRAVFGESYWGDQGIFLRRRYEKAWRSLEKFPLMEDVELSRLLRREGETVYLGRETKAGTAKWGRGTRFNRFILVFATVIRFRLAGLVGKQAESAKTLYSRYYGK